MTFNRWNPIPVAVGQRFGRLVVRAIENRGGRKMIVSDCDCGGTSVAQPGDCRPELRVHADGEDCNNYGCSRGHYSIPNPDYRPAPPTAAMHAQQSAKAADEVPTPSNNGVRNE